MHNLLAAHDPDYSRCVIRIRSKIIYEHTGGEEVGSETNNRAALEDVGHNADLYIANQEGNTQN